jgi:hypothetical protein
MSDVDLPPSDEQVNSLIEPMENDVTDIASSSMNLADTAAGPATRRRGRPKKTEAPLTVAVVRRSPRNHNDGYIHPGLSDTRRRSSSVTAAPLPAVLQVKEMQRIGIEECHIAPEELSEERLCQERDA